MLRPWTTLVAVLLLLLGPTAIVVTGLSVGSGAGGARPRRAARMPSADGADVGIELDMASSPTLSRRAALGGLGLASSVCLCGGMPNAAHACTSFQEAAFAKAMSSPAAQEYEDYVVAKKAQLFQALPSSGDVLEIGIGAGPNLKHYNAKNHRVTGLDPNSYMLESAAKKGRAVGLESLKLVEGKSEALPFPDNSFDAVVATLVLCTVDDTEAAVAEIARVLKPGGRYLWIEHVLSETDPLLAMQQSMFNPLQLALAGGCNLNRRSGEVIRAAATSGAFVAITDHSRFSATGEKGERFLIGPHEMGVAWVPV
mmetsp:Transcript_1664/g.3406  ORF Transcript_1664/g.3406 Transcript_1664/m.3406 type:complete len:312 (-) Transcript_1664:75-1010(-)